MPQLTDFVDLSPFTHIIGIDEVGWGALAGPLTVGAVALPIGFTTDIKDSKKYTTHRSRKRAWEVFLDSAGPTEGYSSTVCSRDPWFLDAHGMQPSLHEMNELLIYEYLVEYPRGLIVLDGETRMKLPDRVVSIPKADSFVPVVSAASVLAKLTRDEFMSGFPNDIAEWGFDRHMGYGTQHHLKMLKKFGGLEGIHRHSIVKNIVK